MTILTEGCFEINEKQSTNPSFKKSSDPWEITKLELMTLKRRETKYD